MDVLDADNGDVGLVLSDRIINMPPAIAPPSYRMLLEEIQWANEDVCRDKILVLIDRKSLTILATS